MDPKLKYSNAVRKRAIHAAIMLLTKAGCEVTEMADENGCTLAVFNPPDNADNVGAMAQSCLSPSI